MADTLVELSTKPWFREGVKQLGLPIPTPQKLKRSRGPRVERALDGYDIMVNGTKGAVDTAIAKAIVSAGAQPHLITEAPVSSAWSDAGEAFGRPVKVYASAPEERVPVNAMVFDATHLNSPEALRALYDFFHGTISGLKRCGRIVVIGRPPEEEKNPPKAAAQGLEGFVRSLTKEIGRKALQSPDLLAPELKKGFDLTKAPPLTTVCVYRRPTMASG